jgi:hypothetical protein
VRSPRVDDVVEGGEVVAAPGTGGKEEVFVTSRMAGVPGRFWSWPASIRRFRSMRLRTTASEFTPRAALMPARVRGPR